MNDRFSVWFIAIFYTFIVSCTQPDHAGESEQLTQQKLVIKDVNILAMVPGVDRVLQHYSVVISQGKIIRVAPSSQIKDSGDAVIVEAQGKTLMPGLIDMHVHIWDEAELPAYLAYGVTTVRNASGMPFHLEFQADIEAGRLQGPRLVTTGPILNGDGPNTQPNHQMVNTAEEARAAVQWQYAQGYRHLKVYSNLSRAAYEAILHESKRLGMSLMGHTPEGVREAGIPFEKPFNIPFAESLRQGFVTIEHMESIIWHALADQLDEQKVRGLAREIAASQVAIDATLIAHHNLVRVAQTQGAYLKRPGVETLNPFITELEQASYAFWAGQAKDARQVFDEFYLRAVKIFHEEGVTLVAGTDSGIFINIPGRSLIEELQLFSKAGLTAYQVIETSTVNAARALGFEDHLGKVKQGYVADLILLNDNPLENLDTLLKPEGLVVKGRWYGQPQINQLRVKASNTSYDRTARRVQEGLSAQGSSLH